MTTHNCPYCGMKQNAFAQRSDIGKKHIVKHFECVKCGKGWTLTLDYDKH